MLITDNQVAFFLHDSIHCHANYSVMRYKSSIVVKIHIFGVYRFNHQVRVRQLVKIMEMTFYLNEKFVSKFQIFWAIAEKVNFIILNCIKHAGSPETVVQVNNFYSFYRFELKLCRMVELCILNNRMFFFCSANSIRLLRVVF